GAEQALLDLAALVGDDEAVDEQAQRRGEPVGVDRLARRRVAVAVARPRHGPSVPPRSTNGLPAARRWRDTRPMRRGLSIAVVGALVAPAAAAPAPGGPPAKDAARPWGEGVTDDRKALAQSKLEAGNALFLEKKYGEALERYREALAAWDHPAIRFNV